MQIGTVGALPTQGAAVGERPTQGVVTGNGTDGFTYTFNDDVVIDGVKVGGLEIQMPENMAVGVGGFHYAYMNDYLDGISQHSGVSGKHDNGVYVSSHTLTMSLTETARGENQAILGKVLPAVIDSRIIAFRFQVVPGHWALLTIEKNGDGSYKMLVIDSLPIEGASAEERTQAAENRACAIVEVCKIFRAKGAAINSGFSVAQEETIGRVIGLKQEAEEIQNRRSAFYEQQMIPVRLIAAGTKEYMDAKQVVDHECSLFDANRLQKLTFAKVAIKAIEGDILANQSWSIPYSQKEAGGGVPTLHCGPYTLMAERKVVENGNLDFTRSATVAPGAEFNVELRAIDTVRGMIHAGEKTRTTNDDVTMEFGNGIGEFYFEGVGNAEALYDKVKQRATVGAPAITIAAPKPAAPSPSAVASAVGRTSNAGLPAAPVGGTGGPLATAMLQSQTVQPGRADSRITTLHSVLGRTMTINAQYENEG